MKSCAFTGHRVIPEGQLRPLEELLRRGVEYAYSEGCRLFFAGGALGFDTMAAKAVIALKIKHPDVGLCMVLPCKDQASKWTAAQRDVYEYTLKCADEVVYVSDEYTKTCMHRRNLYLAEHCDMLIAYSGRENSGAAQTVRMAQRLGKRIYNLYPAVARNGQE